ARRLRPVNATTRAGPDAGGPLARPAAHAASGHGVSVAAPSAQADSRSVGPARTIRGSLSVPGDKSISHRAALFNALGEGEARVTNFSPGADCESTLGCLRQLGVQIERDSDRLRVQGVGLGG